ncbi:alpha/beta hydrolase [Methylophaga sp. UBA5088]|mgnify:FL=1|uniref:alpha/beta hydrolase n=2 Tax=Methylophaga TaxID=40222 RepID=UPI00259CBB59|nr:alpha/beta hydrolase [Methylophaga sp. UBA5088]
MSENCMSKTCRHVLRSTVTAVLVSICQACSPVTVLNALVPDNGYQKLADKAYGDENRQKLDIYLPAHTISDHPLKTVVFFYGGSWDSGSKADYKFVAEALTSAGYIVVIPDYRLYPEVVFPAFVDDGARAVTWVLEHINEYGGEAGHVILAGHSAGAHIAALLSLDATYLAKYHHQPTDVTAMIGLAGPYDFLPLQSDRLKQIFGPEKQRWQSQPIHFVEGNNPPMLLMVGNKDRTVLPKNSVNLATKIKQKNGAVELVEFDDLNHVAMVSHLAKPLRGSDELRQTIIAFINQF